jgi:hypothetical protein
MKSEAGMEAGVNEAPSTAVIVERDGSFFVYQPDLGIVASDGTLEGAYRRFVDTRQTLLAEAARAGLVVRDAVELNKSRPARQRSVQPAFSPSVVGQRSFGSELALFVAKMCVFFVVIGAIVGSVALSLDIKPLAFADISDKAADIARDVSSLSPEKKEQLRRSVGIISRELGPVGDAWRAPPP